MKSINQPNVDIEDIIKKCIESLRDIKVKSYIEQHIYCFKMLSHGLENSIKINRVHKINKTLKIPFVEFEESKKLFKRLYSEKLVNLARIYYDNILNSAPSNICLYCKESEADTLDHYLPQSVYHLFSITPINLLPICGKCNRNKLDKAPTNEKEQFLHPYFDNIENISWLKCDIQLDNNIIFKFHVNENITSDNFLRDKIKYYFDTLKLEQKYRISAASYYSNIRYKYQQQFERGGSDTLKIAIDDDYQSSLQHDKNSYKTTMLNALLNSVEFIHEYFASQTIS